MSARSGLAEQRHRLSHLGQSEDIFYMDRKNKKCPTFLFLCGPSLIVNIIVNLTVNLTLNLIVNLVVNLIMILIALSGNRLDANRHYVI